MMYWAFCFESKSHDTSTNVETSYTATEHTVTKAVGIVEKVIVTMAEAGAEVKEIIETVDETAAKVKEFIYGVDALS